MPKRRLSAELKTGGVRTGWNDDSFAVTCDGQIIIGEGSENSGGPIQNPASFPTPDGYVSHVSFPGYNTYYQAALKGLQYEFVNVIVHNTECALGRPKLIGINVGPRFNFNKLF